MRHSKRASLLAALLVLNLSAPDASAQTTGAVFGPVVREGHRSAQYRSGFDPDSNAFAQRIHYQHAIDGSFMWRVIAQARKSADSDVDFDFVQGELFWHLTRDDRPWQTGVRFDVRIRDRGRPATVGVNWTNQFSLPSGWHSRLLLLTALDVGDGARDGIALQTRANLYRRLSGTLDGGLEMFSSYGTTDDFADFDEQRHGVGPFVSIPLASGWSVFAGALFGLTDATPDTDLRLWVTRNFK